jgi:hypothetical protein
MQNRGKTPTAAILALGVAAVLAGCATSPIERRERVVSDTRDTQRHIVETRAQTAATMAALNGLQGKSGDPLRLQYQQFDREYERLESLANDLTSQAASVRREGDELLKTWQEEAAALQDAEMRRRAEERRAERAGAYQAVANEMSQTQQTLYSFLTDLRDIRRYLQVDLTPNGVASVQDRITAANQRVGQVTQSLAQLNQRLEVLAQRAAPGGTTASGTTTQTSGSDAGSTAAGTTGGDSAAPAAPGVTRP